MKKLVFGLVLCISMAIVAQAIPITVENFSFEEPGTFKCECWDGERVNKFYPSENYPDVPGWSSDTEANDSGVEPGGRYGIWAGFIMSFNGQGVADPAVWQLTGHTVDAGESFTLKIDLQNNWTAPGVTPELQLRLYYDDAGVRMPAATVVVNPSKLVWSEFSVSLAADDVPGSIGNKLGIEIDNVSADRSWMGLDNVRLDMIPEPATMALFSIGGLALLRRRRA